MVNISKTIQIASLVGSSCFFGYFIGKSGVGTNKGEVNSDSHWPIFGSVSASSLVALPNSPNDVTQHRKMSRISEIMKYGYPGMDQLISYSDFVISYDRRNRVPHWVFEHLTPDSVRSNNNVDRAKCQFTPDSRVHEFFRADNSDYKKSGYDRGHLAAAGNHRKEQKHCDETFFLSNIAPQVGEGFNRDSWNRLERYVRKLTKNNPNVYVCTGPLYLPRKEIDGKMYVKYEVIGVNTVAVPTHFFKVIIIETADKKLELESYVMPNQKIDDNTPLEVFRVRPEVIEKAAGLIFFSNIQRSAIYSINGKKQ